MGIINHFEKRVELRALTMIKHKKLYAWLGLITFVFQTTKVILDIRKFVGDDWGRAKDYLARERRAKRRREKNKKDEAKCPYKTESASGYNKPKETGDSTTEGIVDRAQA
jgi:hypothetical protein